MCAFINQHILLIRKKEKAKKKLNISLFCFSTKIVVVELNILSWKFSYRVEQIYIYINDSYRYANEQRHKRQNIYAKVVNLFSLVQIVHIFDKKKVTAFLYKNGQNEKKKITIIHTQFLLS